jgi:hypothetical protein
VLHVVQCCNGIASLVVFIVRKSRNGLKNQPVILLAILLLLVLPRIETRARFEFTL